MQLTRRQRQTAAEILRFRTVVGKRAEKLYRATSTPEKRRRARGVEAIIARVKLLHSLLPEGVGEIRAMPA